MKYHITCNTDNNYAQHCVAMLCSLFENNKSHRFFVHILINELSEENRNAVSKLVAKYDNEVVFHKVDENLLEGLQYRKHRPLTKAAYYRILLPSIIDQSVDIILYLDCDMIVLGDITELFLIDITDYALAATGDITPWTSKHRLQLNLSMQDYAFCSGIMLINLRYWRKHYAQSHLLNFSKLPRTPVYLHDQDALNYVFKNQWFELPPKWNHTSLSVSVGAKKMFDNEEYVFSPKIIHYSADLKPWYDVWFPEKKHYTNYLQKSGYSSHFQKKNLLFKIQAYKAVIRYYISRYIYPLIPEIIEIIIKDIIFTIKIIFVALYKPSLLSKLLLQRWESKH